MSNLQAELEVLRKEKSKAIKACQFAQAKALDSHIKSLQQQIVENKTANKVLNAKIKFNTAKETVGKELVAAQMKCNEDEKNKRESFQKRLIEIENINEKEKEKQAKELADCINRASAKPVVEAENMRIQAQKLAQLGNFDLAEKMINESELIKEKVVAERIEGIMKKSQIDSAEIEKKHQEEVESCKMKRESALKQIRDNFDSEIDRKNKELITTSIRLGLGPCNSNIAGKLVQLKANILNEAVELNSTKEPAKSPMMKQTPSMKSPMMKQTPSMKSQTSKQSLQTPARKSSLSVH